VVWFGLFQDTGTYGFFHILAFGVHMYRNMLDDSLRAGRSGDRIPVGGGEIFRQSRPAVGPTQPPVNGYRVFPEGKVRPGRAADHSPPSSAAVMEE